VIADADVRAQDDRAVVLRISGLAKTFAGTRALHDVDLEVRQGEVHCLVGGNGSGKSTLVKVLAGVYRGDHGGMLEVGGLSIGADEMTPALARAAKLLFVHQHPAVFPELSVAENLAIGTGFPLGLARRIRWRELVRHTQVVLDRFEIDVRPDVLVASLSPAVRTTIAIARALQHQEGESDSVLVLDEPSASLPVAEVEVLLAAIRRYSRAGQTIIFIGHRLDEVLGVADRVTVLRDGKRVATAEAADLDEPKLIELILGQPMHRVFPHMPRADAAEIALEVQGLSGGPVSHATFGLRHREVLGIAGLLGSGRTELLKMIFGALPLRRGEMLHHGKPYRPRSPLDAMRRGVAYIPEDRAAAAAFLDMGIDQNLSIARLNEYWRGVRLSSRRERSHARDAITAFGIRASSERAPLSTLSGGNQQKVILARWLRRNPRLLLLDEPTQGVDVGARAEIYELIRQAVEGGASAIVVSSDFEELAHVCDRVVVLRGGAIVAEVVPPELDSHRLTQLAYPAKEVAT
jgi:ribose transport system ATP-binding protein